MPQNQEVEVVVELFINKILKQGAFIMKIELQIVICMTNYRLFSAFMAMSRLHLKCFVALF